MATGAKPRLPVVVSEAEIEWFADFKRRLP